MVSRMTRPTFAGISVLAGLLLAFVVLIGCGGNRGLSRVPGGEETYGASGARDTSSDYFDTTEANPDDLAVADSADEEERGDDSGFTDTTDSVDESELWRTFESAEEYYGMGVIANRESSWEEAQYYFEKALKLLANLDVAMDSSLTPEAVKYSTLLDNIVADYRVTLRSLGRLDEDAAPSAIIERFGDLEAKLGRDSLHVYRTEGGKASYDLPVVMNDRVRRSIVYFQTVANDAFRRYLGRSRKYFPLFSRILKENGLPEDLVYLSLVESGYNPHAYSWARAMGLWQFIASTGKLYGLQRNWWVDERKDPVKSTKAAAVFLKELYDTFGSWELAMAAYNGGPGRVQRSIKQQHTSDFWKLRLRRQTMDYVPLIYAAIIIGKEPEKYGFSDIQYEPEIVWDEVNVDRCLDLRTVAKELGCSVDDLRALNPELLRSYTPPSARGEYALKIPRGMTKKFWAAYNNMPSPEAANFARHKVKRRESLSSIANKYGVSQYAILEANNLQKGARLKAGRELIIPVTNEHRRSGLASSDDLTVVNGEYTVRRGDTPWDISRALGVTVDELRRVNYLKRGAKIYVGQKLKIPGYALTPDGSTANLDNKVSSRKAPGVDTVEPDPPDETPRGKSASDDSNIIVYTVRSGDTIWDLARKYGTSTEHIRTMNALGRSSRIHIGQKLIIEKGSKGGNYVIYKVKNGDTLTRIAQKYRTSIEKIVAANSLSDPHQLKIGDRIKIYVN
jgi:membrane-bound lytic murein transglycosylase D